MTLQNTYEVYHVKVFHSSGTPMLHHPDSSKPFGIHTDVSKQGVGAILAQQINQELKLVRFASHAFSEIESRWHIMQMELFPVKRALKQFRPYVFGTKTKIMPIHNGLLPSNLNKAHLLVGV